MKKRILGFLLTMCLIIGLLPVTAFAGTTTETITAYIGITNGTYGYELVNDGTVRYLKTNGLTTSGAGTKIATATASDYEIKLYFPANSDTVEIYLNGVTLVSKTTANNNSLQIGNATYNNFNAKIIIEDDSTITAQSAVSSDTGTAAAITSLLAADKTLTITSNNNAKLTLTTLANKNRVRCLYSSNKVTFQNANVESADLCTTSYPRSGMLIKGDLTIDGGTVKATHAAGTAAIAVSNVYDGFSGSYSATIKNGANVTIESAGGLGALIVAGPCNIDASTVTVKAGGFRPVAAQPNGEAETASFVVNVTNATAQISTSAEDTNLINYKVETHADATAYKYFITVPAASEPVELPVFYGTSAVLGNDLSLGFAIETAKVPYEAGMYAKLVRTYADGTADYEKTIPVSDPGDAAYYDFWYDGIAAKEMNDTVSITLYNSADEALTQTYTDSVTAYALRMLRMTEKPEDLTEDQFTKLKILLVDMLNYGAMAQVQFGYDEENLVNDNLTEQGTQTMTACENKAATTTGEGYLGTAFVLNNNIAMAMALDASVIGKNCTAKVAFTNYKEVAQEEVTLNADASSTENTTVFVFNGLVAADGRCEVTWKFYDGETLVLTVTDSMEAYVGRMIGEYAYLEALMKYSDAAYAYFTA